MKKETIEKIERFALAGFISASFYFFLIYASLTEYLFVSIASYMIAGSILLFLIGTYIVEYWFSKLKAWEDD